MIRSTSSSAFTTKFDSAGAIACWTIPTTLATRAERFSLELPKRLVRTDFPCPVTVSAITLARGVAVWTIPSGHPTGPHVVGFSSDSIAQSISCWNGWTDSHEDFGLGKACSHSYYGVTSRVYNWIPEKAI